MKKKLTPRQEAQLNSRKERKMGAYILDQYINAGKSKGLKPRPFTTPKKEKSWT